MIFTVLGDITVTANGHPIQIGGPRQRVLLAALIANRGAPLPLGRIVDVLWDGVAVPDNAERTAQTYISKLRASVGRERLHRSRAGYQLAIDDEELDACQFEAMVGQTRALRIAGRQADARNALDTGLRLWSGKPFAELGDRFWALAEAARLTELHATAAELGVELSLELDDLDAALERIAPLVELHPLRESVHRLELLTRYRVHGAAEAARTYQRFRTRLVEATGLEPSAALSELEAAMLEGEVDDPLVRSTPLLGGYELHEKVREGSSTEVFRAVQPGTGREVWVESVQRELADRADFIRRFEGNAKVVASLEHPAIIAMFDFWRAPGRAYVVWRAPRGRSLAAASADRPLPDDDALRLIVQVGEALAATHECGVAHRAVMAENIFVDDDGDYSLGFFELGGEPADPGSERADFLGLTETVRRSRVGTVIGNGEVEQLLSDAGDLASLVSGAKRRLADSQVVRPRARDDTVRNPYLGLAAFREADAGRFFGREGLVDHLIASMADSGEARRLLAVVGPSGSGKSSVVLAGLLPALRRGRVAGSEEWFVISMVPGSDPNRALEEALRSVAVREVDESDRQRTLDELLPELLAGPSDALLVIDQFEELYTHCPSETAERFVTNLVTAVTASGSRLRVIITLRADFYDQPLRHRLLAPLIASATVAVEPLTTIELERAIIEPATLVGTSIEPALVAALVTDAGDQSGALPLVQFALTELWDARSDELLRLAPYQQLGGIGGALVRRAEDTLAGFDDQGRRGAERTFGRLVRLGEGVGDTRRRVLRSELPRVDDHVVDAFGEARLLTFDRDAVTRQPTVEIAHETILSRWPRLRDWIDENRQDLRTHRHLTVASAAWDEAGRPVVDLYRGSRLETADAWVKQSGPTLNPVERDFLDFSARHRDETLAHEAEIDEATRQQNRRLRRLFRTVAALLIVALLASGAALRQRSQATAKQRDAESAESIAETRRMSADAAQLAPTERRTALLLALEAQRRHPGPESLSGLQRALIGIDNFLGCLAADVSYTDMDWLTDDRLIGLHDTGFDVIQPWTAEILTTVEVRPGEAFALDRQTGLIAISTAQGAVQIYDQGGSTVTVLPHDQPVRTMAFSPDGTTIATGDRQGTLRLWDANSGAPLAAPVIAHPELSLADVPSDMQVPAGAAHESRTFPVGIRSVAFDPSGRRIATAGGFFVRVFDADDLRPLEDIDVTRPLEIRSQGRGPGRPVTVGWRSGDELVVGVESYLQRYRISTDELVSEELVSSLLIGQGNDGFAVDWTDDMMVRGLPDGMVQVIGPGDDDYVEIVAAAQGVRPEGFDVAISPDGRTVAVAGIGVSLFALDERRLIARSVSLPDPFEATVSDDGRVVATVSATNERSTLWYLDAEPPVEIPTDRSLLDVFAPLVTEHDGVLDFQDRETRRSTGFEVEAFNAWAGARHPSEPIIAVGLGTPGPPMIRIITTSTGATTEIDDFVERGDAFVASLSFSADGSRLAGSSDSGAAFVWDSSTGERIGEPLSSGAGQVISLAYAPEGEFLYTAGADGGITERDAMTTQPTGRVLLGATRSQPQWRSFGFSPDGRYLASVLDARPMLHDLATGQLIGDPFPGDLGLSVTVSRDGRFATSTLDDHAMVWDLDVELWVERACLAVGRNFTPTEWAQFGVADTVPPATCDRWPTP